jgi:hypothetical protein
MLQNREVKMENAKIRKAQEEEFLKLKEKEMNQRIMKKAETLRKKQEREMLQKVMYEEARRKSRLDDDDDDDIPAPRLKAKPQPAPVQQYQETYQQQYPAFRWV